MKSLQAILLGVLLLASASTSRAGTVGTTLFKAKVSGTAQTQLVLGPTDGRIDTSPLNNARIFAEFGVSPDLYALVFEVGSTTVLELVPKSSMAKLPTIEVVKLGTGVGQVVDTHSRTLAIAGPIAAGTATNLFQGIAGEVTGAVKYDGAFPPTAFKSLSLDVRAQSMDAGLDAILKFKITTSGVFTQTP
jgi:hypothetical protein